MQSTVQMIAFNVDELRARLRIVPDEKLHQFGEAARYMCTPEANLGKPPLLIYLLQLEEATAEWRRRHPKEWAYLIRSKICH
jgi:hypothetical protein